jgi:hypothetical protein
MHAQKQTNALVVKLKVKIGTEFQESEDNIVETCDALEGYAKVSC